MMDRELLISAIIDHAAHYHGDTEIVSVNTDWRRIHAMAMPNAVTEVLKLASALAKRGMKKSDRIGTLAWNNHRHLELYYGVSGSGLVCHTLNPRLFPEQLVYIINHAEDRILFFDQTFLPLGRRRQGPIENRGKFRADGSADDAMQHRTSLDRVLRRPDQTKAMIIIPGLHDHYRTRRLFPLLYIRHHRQPQGRSCIRTAPPCIHAMMSATPDVMNFSASDCLLPVVPMFHVNAWGTPYAAPLVGAKMVMPGPGLDGKSLTDLFNKEKVTISAGVPTIWAGLLPAS